MSARSTGDIFLDLRLAAVSMAERDQAPNLLPVTLVLSVVLWIFTMTGGQQIFVKEVLGGCVRFAG